MTDFKKLDHKIGKMADDQPDSGEEKEPTEIPLGSCKLSPEAWRRVVGEFRGLIEQGVVVDANGIALPNERGPRQ